MPKMNGTSQSPDPQTRFKLTHLSKHIAYTMKEKIGSLAHQTLSVLGGDHQALKIDPQAIQHIEQGLTSQLNHTKNASDLHLAQTNAFSEQDNLVIARINEQVRTYNRNNVTRTAAYLDFYKQHPEVHWAFLAHMVSRNGGWSMTDLKGALLFRILSQQKQKDFFSFLERCNAYIFQDAFPQLLLYAESKKRQRPMFHLLPSFHVSAFMRPIWAYFYEKRSSALLTVAMIMNEQQYIEKRVVQHPYYKETVLDTLAFHLQGLLQLTNVVFPYHTSLFSSSTFTRLGGQTIQDFSQVSERIDVGKRLYGLLFGPQVVREGAISFATQTPHTGSRMDFWSEVFTSRRVSSPSEPYGEERLIGCKLKPQAPPLYSPALTDVWPDIRLSPPSREDWFDALDVTDVTQHLRTVKPVSGYDMTSGFCRGLKRLEWAVLAQQFVN
ncbi:DUF2515 domain-containing protein [Caldalkalibacillus salinus]|uniref:DUF2515 domain-containing protein n=1 Tax=Caldalkalibacillus salinus TaxID=2803787 RepID=UPI00192502BF|nr:DUF2515 domain-containing protein [Caldalkalibacillus salinus]